MHTQELETKLSLIAEKLNSLLPGIVAIYLHGSASKGGIRQDSDIDLGVLFEHGAVPDAKKLFIIKPEIEKIAERSVDIGGLFTNNPVFAKEVITNGKRLLCNDQLACDEFEMYVLSFYCKLNEDRRPVLDSYQH